MPDTHSGYGMPIGGVIAAEKVIIPNAVGVDIGCGMSFVQTNIPVERLIEIEKERKRMVSGEPGKGRGWWKVDAFVHCRKKLGTPTRPVNRP